MTAHIRLLSIKFVHVLLAIASALLLSINASAQSIGACDEASLRAAIQQGGTVLLQCDGIITLSQTITISNPVTLEATGHNVAISGGDKVQIFQVQSNASLTLIGVTLQNGLAIHGGAILNNGSLAATNCTFKNNTTFAIFGNPGVGGAIFTAGMVNLDQCTFEQNIARSTNASPYYPVENGSMASGGAMFIDSGKLTARNCTWLQNTAQGARGDYNFSSTGGAGRGGAVFAAGGELQFINNTFASNRAVGGTGSSSFSFGYAGGDAKGAAMYIGGAAVRMLHGTIAFNEAVPGCAGWYSSNIGISISSPYGVGAGAGIYNESGTVSVANSILATNLVNGPVDPTGYGDPSPQFSYTGNYSGAVNDLQFNISSDETVRIVKSKTDPQLGPLDFYGGATKSYSLLPTSPAIDFANDRYSPPTDQRGVSRSSGRVADCGAFEFESQPVPSSDTTALRAQIAHGGKITLTNPSYFHVAEQIDVLKDVEVDASKAGVVFDGLGGSRIFHVVAGVKFTLINASLVNGRDRNGAGLLNEGQAVLLDCRFNGNSAVGAPGLPGTNSFTRGAPGGPGSNGDIGRGGAIDNLGSLVTSNCFFINNSATGGKGGGGAKGAPASSFYLSALYRNCRSQGLGGGGGSGGEAGLGAGAAIYNQGSASIQRCQIGFNTSIGGAGGRGGDSGPKGCDASIRANNRAGDAGAGASATGAVSSTGVLEITETAFQQNMAIGGDGGTGGTGDPYWPYTNVQGLGGAGGDAAGAALYLRNVARLTNVTIAKSIAQGGAGGATGFYLMSIGYTNYSGTGGIATGGAVESLGSATIVNCTLIENKVNAGSGGPANGPYTAPGLPGFAIASEVFSDSPALTIKNCLLSASNGTNALAGGFIDAGHNIASGPVSGFTAPTSVTNTDPRLIEINSVGSLPFYRPALDSPARDAIPPNDAPPIDQRGVTRPVGAAADIGAIELASFEIPPTMTLDTSTALTLQYTGIRSVDYILYSTTDFRTWSAVRTNRADATGSVFFDSLDRGSLPHEFFTTGEKK